MVENKKSGMVLSKIKLTDLLYKNKKPKVHQILIKRVYYD
jgi:hypothetical protein